MYRSLITLLLAVLVAMVAVYLWGLDRGLDLIDEGDFLLSSTAPALYPQPSSYAFFMARLPVVLPDQLANYRFASICANFASTALLIIAFTRWVGAYVDLSDKREGLVAVSLNTLISGLLFATVFAPTIAYNIMTAFLISLSAASLFAAFHALQSSTGERSSDAKFVSRLPLVLYMVAAGFLLGAAFFVKFSSAICFFILSTVAICFLTAKRSVLRAILPLYAAGILLAIIVYFASVESAFEFWHRFQLTVVDLELLSGGSHSPGTVFLSSFISFRKHFSELICTLILILATTFGAIAFKGTRFEGLLKLMPWGGLLMLVGFWLWRAITKHEVHSSIIYWPIVFVGTAFAINLIVSGMTRVLSQNARAVVFALAYLALIPFVVSLGTNGPLLWHAIGNIAPTYLALGFAALLLGKDFGSNFFPLFSIALMAFAAIVQYTNAFVFHFKNGPSLLANTVESISTPRVARTKLTPELASFISLGHQILSDHGFKDGDPILGVYDLPGFVWAVNGTSPVFARYSQAFPSQTKFFLDRLPTQNWQRLFLVVSEASGRPIPTQEVTMQLQKAGMHFPADFQLIGRAFRPNQYWNGGSIAYFYALKR